VRTLGALLAERRLIGREAELDALRDGPPITVVHGVAGAGKSALLRAFAAERADVTWVDGRAIEPTPAGFAAAAGPAPDVLVIDTAERLRLLDGWLRTTYLPSLPHTSRVVIATRDAPGAIWRAAFGELLRTIPLGPLEPAAAAELLHGLGLDEAQACEINRFACGHPLSLQLAASTRQLPAVAEELAALYLDGLDAPTRDALDATCILRRVTLSLLGALVDDPQEAFARLRALPFAELASEGLVIHDTVREAVATLLRATDPVRHRAYRTAAWRQIRAELPRGGWGSVADMIALVEEPLVREAFFPTAVQHYAVEPARGDDWEAIAAIVERHGYEDMRPWWDAVPHAFRVARSPRGVVVAFTILCPLDDVPRALVLEAWREHLRAHPVPKDQVLAARLALAWGTGAAPSPCFSALLRDVERASLETPAVRRIYTVSGSEEQITPLGYIPLGDGALVCDLGPESVAGWLSMLAARGLDVEAAGLDAHARELRLDGRRIALTKLETELLRYLMDREGQPVTRAGLQREVWGHEWPESANAVDVAISGLRRKLGAHARSIATVRGVGFRFTGWSSTA
jgi:hypothetical protein